MFLGQFQLSFEQLFGEGMMAYHDVNNQVRDYFAQWHPLQTHHPTSKRRRRTYFIRRPPQVDGAEIKIKLGLVHLDEKRELTSHWIKYTWQMLLASHKIHHAWRSSASLETKRHSRQRFRRRKRQSRSLKEPPVKEGTTNRTMRPRRFRKRRKEHIAKFHPDVVGVAFLEISHANDLPPERNITRTGFDMDPFVVVSYGTSTFRTSVRHSPDPVWNEKLFFHVRHNESSYRLKFAVYDKDKFTGNDLVAWQEISIMDIINRSRYRYGDPTSIDEDMDRHTISLHMADQTKWKDRHPTLTIRAKFVPYDQMRKMFWMALAKTYDVEGNGALSRLEMLSMLETVGSTISEATLDKFWKEHRKDPLESLSIENLVDSLERHMLAANEHPTTAINRTPSGSEEEDEDEFKLIPLPSAEEEPTEEWIDSADSMEEQAYVTASASSEDDGEEVFIDALGVQYDGPSPVTFGTEQEVGQPVAVARRGSRDSSNEKVIRLKECPICHRPNLSKRAQMDIVTHVATCAANDWTTVDRFLMGNFLTEAYAQRQWFVKLVSKVGYGKYSLGTNNANILIQDRRTGQLVEERMSVYIRLGMRLVYKGMKTGIQSKTAQRILTNMTFRQGRKFDAPHSVREIPGFIKFHQIDLSEVLQPISSFQSFNEFFYRKLKPGARPCDASDDPGVAVSPADCRMTAFENVGDATRLWIKGIEFSLDKLLGRDGSAFDGGSLAVFRLAPSDYHRFHAPVDGVVTDIQHIAGQYYTVNPMAIRTTLDVFGENTRTVVTMESEQFGQVAVVCVGAMLVGSVVMTAQIGSYLRRTDEMGYFAFGGSTLVVLWQKDAIVLDQDLLTNSGKTLETLVQVGNRVGCHSFRK
ncbi:hypothetical protein DFQ28_010774 [Apophysomyces sp. BC1034]|nr:hypothetical protein DFQ28_010774 [Apophysomyces sp. BC1034]